MPDPLRRLGNVAQHTREVAAEILDHLDSLGLQLPDHPDTGDQVVHGMGTSSEHATGYALDFMTVVYPSEVMDAIVEWAWANRDRIGLRHIIAAQTIRSTRTAPGEVRPMDDRGSVTENHYDHVHLYLPDPPALDSPPARPGGAQSVPAPRPPAGRTAPPYPLPSGHYFGPKSGPVSSVSGYYSHRSHLRRWQQRMNDRGWTITADGLYGPRTKAVAIAFQREKGLAVDGLIGPATWDAAWTAPVT